MCSLHLTHPSVHTWSSGQPTVQRPRSSRGLPARAGIRTHNLGLPQVTIGTPMCIREKPLFHNENPAHFKFLLSNERLEMCDLKKKKQFN